MASSHRLFQSINVIFFLLSIWSTPHVHCQSNIFSISDFGAISDAQTDSKQAILNAWNQSCATNGGTIVVPKGNYLLSDVELLGPCIGTTKFVLDGTLIAPEVPTPNIEYWIMFRALDSLSISGTGTLDGNGASYWKTNNPDIITSLVLEHVNDLSISGIHSVNSKKFHVSIHNCNGVAITNIHATAPADSPNTDGIHLQASSTITISGSSFATGDDCISIGEGVANVNITEVNCGPGHGISIGSLGKYPDEKEVSSIRVTNCNFTDTQNGMRIKTFGPSPPGLVSDVSFEGIRVNNVDNPIIIDQHYCPHSECDGDSSVSIQGVKFIDVRGTSSAPTGVKILCSRLQPCKDIELIGVSLTYDGQPTTAICSSVHLNFRGTNQIPSTCS
ncbi:exopolygalacturonase-like [Salvia splendens]|uniref:exopolygalacturonase-like n=1 Tax=Salvia splendens TaxID=180675 RepID=UPI001C27D050|nr:exopolygalacturonase-like [Salvia splendens]